MQLWNNIEYSLPQIAVQLHQAIYSYHSCTTIYLFVCAHCYVCVCIPMHIVAPQHYNLHVHICMEHLYFIYSYT